MNNRHNPNEAPTSQLAPPVSCPDGPEGFGGWLILSIFWLVIPFFVGIKSPTTYTYFQPELWQALTNSIPDGSYHSLWQPAILFRFISLPSMMLFSIYLLRQFCRKSARTPRLFIIFCLANLILLTIDTWFYLQISWRFTELRDNNDQIYLVGFLALSCLIWIPYFCRSTRVKNTFVN